MRKTAVPGGPGVLWRGAAVALVAGLGFSALPRGEPGAPQQSAADTRDEYAAAVRPLLQQYCLGCHSTKAKKGGLDLERFASPEQARKDLKAWQQLVERVDAAEMPPTAKPQPTDEERRRLLTWARGFLDAEARARAGDPGRVPLRRLSNAEYDDTIRDLTGVDLWPTREFPADGAAGEGFTNAAEALSDISPTLLDKYLAAAKDVSEHALLLPDGFRFSPTKTRRDWTDESTAHLRHFYAGYVGGDGRLPVRPYLAAAVRHRDALLGGKATPEEVAVKEKLNPKYFAILWRILTDNTPSHPLDAIRARWRTAQDGDVPALAAAVEAWQAALWKTVKVGSYIRPEGKGYADSTTRQIPADPPAAASVPLRAAVKPAPGQSDVVVYLDARDLLPPGAGPVVWGRPRFEAPGKPPLLLRDYAEFGPAFEADYPTAFADSVKYLAAAADAARDPKRSADDLAKERGLDATFLKRWIDVLAVPPPKTGEAAAPATPLELLEEKTKDDKRPAISGWHKNQSDLPVLVTNDSDKAEQIPGHISPHGVAVHPLPQEFVAVAWNSPLAGQVRVAVRVKHAHPACGNGVAWWLEHRRAGQATPLDGGVLDLGQEAKPAVKTVKLDKGDQLVLAVDARDGDHACDLTEIAFTVTDDAKPERVWDLAADVVSNVLDGNPHADRLGHADTWSFVRGASKGKSGGPAAALIPPDSVLGRWRQAAADPTRQDEATRLAGQVQALLIGPRPPDEKAPDRVLYDKLLAIDGPLFAGVAVARLAKPRPKDPGYALPKKRFGAQPDGPPVDDASLTAASGEAIEVRLPAALFVGREFVVDGRVAGDPRDRVVHFRARTAPPGPDARWDGAGPVAAVPGGSSHRRLLDGYADFRRCFPLFLCFPPLVPNDEVVTLKMFHREDEPLERLFLGDEERSRLDRLWDEHRFISRQPAAENSYLPLFIGFVTQDQPKEMVAFFEGQRPAFQKRADEFRKEEEAAIPRQVNALLDFAARAYRRPLQEKEKADLLNLYKAIRDKGAGHEEAFRGVLARVLVAPAFLFRIEHAPPGKAAGPVDDWELATRLSYFLWSSAPDEELRQLAAAGRLHDPEVLAAQTRRMLKDEKLRSLAVEFGTQWIHIRGFDEFKEKNEQLFPTFTDDLRRAMYEEAIRFFQDLFQNDRPVTDVLDADYTFLNEPLAKHYGAPSVTGPEWRRVEGVKKYGRGGVLGLGAVQAKQAAASRTSPVLRGNWVVETLLGEKLPRPPPDVPRLPEEESAADGLTMRQRVAKHASVPACAVCHQRIDPFGFALEAYDAVGRRRDKDLGGLPIDTKVRLKDGTEFDGIDGLRAYLLTTKRDVVVRLFCRRLLGYALGRSVALSDQPLIDDMVAALKKNDGRLSAAVLAIVRSPQFRMIRGRDYDADD